MGSDEILPCPWCSGAAIAVKIGAIDDEAFQVKCSAEESEPPQGPWANRRRDAIAAWNSVASARAELEEARKRIDELTAHCQRVNGEADEDGNRADVAEADLEEARRRAADLEMMLRAHVAYDEDGSVPFMSHGGGCDNEALVHYVHRNVDDLDPIILDDDGTGLPVLTDEARAALSRHGKEQGA